MNTANRSPPVGYRWIILLLICLLIFSQMIAWLAPAALLTVIRESLRIDIGKAGTLITLITLISGFFMFSGSLLIDRLGLRAVAIVAMTCISIGSGLSFFVASYWQILVLRIIVGMGAGLSTLLPAALTVAWFPAREQPYINSFCTVLGFIAMAAAFGIPGPLLALLGNWGEVLSVLAGTAVLALAAWIVIGRNPPVPPADAASRAAHQRVESGIVRASRRPEVWLLTGTMIGQMWAFNTFSTYLPTFLETVGGLSRVKSGQISSLLPIAGVAGAMICGMGTGMMGRRKPFMWPLMVLALGASLTIATFPVGPVVYLAIAAFGFATAGLSPPLMTTVMDLRGATAEFIGGAFAIIYGVSFISSFFVSPAFGALVPILGARSTMTLFSLPLILSIVLPALLSETGPKRQIRAHATPGS